MGAFKFRICYTGAKYSPVNQEFVIFCDFKTAANIHFVLNSTLPSEYYITFSQL